MTAAAFHPSNGLASNEATKAYGAAIIVLAALMYNFVFCFANTNLFGVGAGLVMATEVCLLGLAFLLLAPDCGAILVIVGAYLSYALFLSALQGVLDLKAIRDILIPIIFLFLGRRLGELTIADRLVTICVWIVLVVGLLEYLFLPQYIKSFDILSYYIARGTVDAASADTTGLRLFASGLRPEERALLPMLGSHRVSSVFLEPVSVGNFGAIAFAWVALRNWERPLIMTLKLAPIVAIFVLGDARFGLMASLASLIVYPLSRHVGRIAVLLAPFMVVFLLAIVGSLDLNLPSDNGFGSRLLLSGQMLARLQFWEAMAFIPVTRFTSDSGYAYALTKIGLLGFVALWALFVLHPVRDQIAWRFRLFMALYIVLLLSISNSIFSIKTAALAWYLLGCLGASREAYAFEGAPNYRRVGFARASRLHNLRRSAY
ncbi:MAG: surface polysaccharide polymerase [Methylocystis sp.]|nr:surface polysaccharide polymerase [Methylocystis sp.]MBI3275087.1 surface polysaccharide polymerase [Methylocystis sp.]